ncbi:hypothetical protein [Clostridium sp. DJ247]|uniref:hypothetical protein n=1 Tax=Clostridium sp. DJ247 TaxID=2726188 RepID=UPI001625BD67|nr:hypothetical protein [Clostridium sp. DJ247]MBC2581314.1 hypothetical protein [Clostridium sp. DJ247]
MNNNNDEKQVGELKNVSNNNKDSSTKIEELQMKIKLELDDLQQKYTNLSAQIQDLQNDKSDLKNSMKTMNDNFQQVSKNVENILAKLDNINGSDKDLDNDIIDKKIDFSVKKIIFNPLRKLAVGTIGSVFSVVDKTTELTCGFKEGFEDIVAEAQYQRKRKQMAAMNE